MKSATITADELRAEVERLNLQRTYPKGFTSREFQAALGCHTSTAQKKLAALVHGGEAKFTGYRPVTKIDGRSGVLPVYTLLKKRP